MSTLGSKLITRQAQRTANMTEDNHLGMLLYKAPHKFEGVVNQLFSSSDYYSQNSLLSSLMGNKGTDVTIDRTSWEWKLKVANSQPLVVVENVSPSNAGKYKTAFKIKLNENWYIAGDVMHPGSADKKYQVRIESDPIKDGDGYLYTVRIMTNDDQLSIPAKYLAAGQLWSKLYSQYGEGSKQGGSIQFGGEIALQNKLSLFRKQYSVTDYAATGVLSVGITDHAGKIHWTWMSYAEVEFWRQWYKELEASVWYTRSTDTVLDSTGRPVQSGPGIQEQLEDSHVHHYTTLTARLIEDYLMSIFYGRVAPGSPKRAVKGFTGEYGMIQFSRAVQDWSQSRGFSINTTTNFDFIKSAKSPYTNSGYSAGYQFVKYDFSNGISIELIHDPLRDDLSINSEIDSVTNLPLASQRITFLDFTGDAANSNIKLMNKKDGYHFWYVQGGIGPLGPLNGGMGSSAALEYEMHVAKSCGVHIEDVTKCGELVLSRD